MNDETPERQALHHFDPMPQLERPVIAPLKRMLSAIPPSDKELAADADAGIAAAAASSAIKRSEARRDAVLAVALAIKRRGQNPVTDWTTKDVDTAYAIGEQLIMLETT